MASHSAEDPSDPSRSICGDAVLTAAAEQISNRGTSRLALPTTDIRHMKHARRARASAKEKFRTAWRQQWGSQHTEYSWDEMDGADEKLGYTSCTADLPLASLGRGYGGHRCLRKAINNLCRFFGVLPPEWSEQPTYHKRKPGKPAHRLSSYRELSLCRVELRSCEQLWGARNSDPLWQHAGPTQLGRTDRLFVVFLEVEVGRIRLELQLPDGVFYGDSASAFDTIPPENIVVRMASRVGLVGEDLAIGDELLASPSLSVVSRDRRAQPVRPEVGFPEGRGTGPALYACGAAEYADCMQRDAAGVGLDPPETMVTAYHSTKDGLDNVEPDNKLAHELAAAWSTGGIPGTMAMEAAGNDPTRLRVQTFCPRSVFA